MNSDWLYLASAGLVLICAALVCAAGGALTHNAAFIDAALALVLTSAVAVVAMLKFVRTRTFQSPILQSAGDH